MVRGSTTSPSPVSVLTATARMSGLAAWRKMRCEMVRTDGARHCCYVVRLRRGALGSNGAGAGRLVSPGIGGCRVRGDNGSAANRGERESARVVRFACDAIRRADGRRHQRRNREREPPSPAAERFLACCLAMLIVTAPYISVQCVHGSVVVVSALSAFSMLSTAPHRSVRYGSAPEIIRASSVVPECIVAADQDDSDAWADGYQHCRDRDRSARRQPQGRDSCEGPWIASSHAWRSLSRA